MHAHGQTQRDFATTITKEDIATLPIRRYAGPVHLVASARDLDRATQDIRHEHVVGFDTETRPVFKKGQSYLPCLVQVATQRAVYLFQLKQFDASRLLTQLLEAPRIVKAGVAMADDLRQLKKVFQFEEKAVLDFGVVAKKCGLEKTGMRNLAGIFLKFRIPKGARTTNWDVPRLTQSQIIYAATDAWASREIYLCFQRLGMLDIIK